MTKSGSNSRPPLVAPKRRRGKAKKPIRTSVASGLAARMSPKPRNPFGWLWMLWAVLMLPVRGLRALFYWPGRIASKLTTSNRKTKKTKSRKATAKPASRGPIGWIKLAFWSLMSALFWTGARIAVLFTLILGGATGYYFTTLPEASALMDGRDRGSVTLLDQDGEVFAWRGDQFGGLVHSRTVNPQLRNAVIATEDKRFYRHFGISPRGMAGAIRTNMREGRHPLKGHGGSTITQQVAKRVFFSDTGTLERKIKEVPMAFAMELKYTKDEILTIYMNRAYLGAGSHGFEAAAQRYFSKSASEVSVAESAMLAGLLKAPSTTAPTRNIAAAEDRANLILGLMEDQGYITQTEHALAVAQPARLSATAAAQAGTYFADWIIDSGPDFILKDTTEDIIIRTTFDKRIQAAAEEALTWVFENKVKEGSKAQAAIVVMSPDGAVRGMVGGRKSGIAGGFNRATQALRQTGSSFKPFVYATALELGWSYDSLILDAPITIHTAGSGDWSPKNYTEEFYGEVTLTEALAQSMNTAAVRLQEEIGRERVRVVARDFGVRNKLADGPALALGASESTLLEMTGAYAGLLNAGRASAPYGVTELTLQGDSAPLIANGTTRGHRVISDHAAGQLVWMMHQVVETGSGGRAKLADRPSAGKTGTTQGARDAWFIGFTGDYVAGVWMGYDDNSKLSGVTGGGLPAEIWKQTMERVHQGMPPSALPMMIPQEPLVTDEVFASARDRAESRDARRAERKARRQAARDQFVEDLNRLDEQAENVLNRVINGIFRRTD